MKRILLFISVAVALMYLVYITLAFMVNYEGIYQQFRKKLASAGYNIKASHINVERFPIPRIEVLGASIDNIAIAKKLEINFVPLSTITLSPEIQIVQADGIKIYTPDSKLDFITHTSLISDLLILLPKMPRAKLSNITVVDAKTKETRFIQNVIIDPNSLGNQMTLNWDRESSTKVSYSLIETGVNVQINYSGPSHSMKLSEVYKQGKLFNGTLRYNIQNLKEFMADRYQDVDLLMTRISSTEPLDISAKFRMDADRIRFSNIKAQSKSIDMNGSADIYYSDTADEINLDFEHINFSELLDAPNMDDVRISKNKQKLALDEVVRNITIKAKKITLGGTYAKDFVLNASIDRKKMQLKKFSGILGQSEGEFNINGNISQNQYRSQFDGNVYFKHKDLNMILSDLGYKDYATQRESSFVLNTDVIATPIDYKLNNLFMKIGAFNASGSASVKLIGSVPRFNLALSLSALDLFDKDVPVLNNVVSYFAGLTQGMKEKNYLQKFIPIREMRYLGDFDIAFKDILIGDTEVDKLRLIAALSPGNIVLNSVYYQDEGNYVTGTGYLSAVGIKPRIEFRIDESSFVTEKFNLAYILSFMKNLYKNYDMEKVKIKADIKTQRIDQKGNEFKDIHLQAKNNGILWNISALKGKYAGGRFDATGSLRMDAMNLNLAYAFNDFNIKSLSTLIPFNIFGIDDGWMSINGMLSTNGGSLAELFYNLYTKSAFLAKNVLWNNFNIDGLVAHTSDSIYEKKQLQKDADHFMRSPKSLMKYLDGEIELDKGLFKITDIDFETHRSKAEADAQYNMYDAKLVVNTNFLFRPPAISLYDSSIDVKLPMRVTGKLGNTKTELDLVEYNKYLDRKDKSKSWMRQQQFPPQVIK